MKIINLNKYIADLEQTFGVVYSQNDVENIINLVDTQACETGAYEVGNTFDVEEVISINKEVKLFTFKVINIDFNYFTDEETGEQEIESISNVIIEYLG